MGQIEAELKRVCKERRGSDQPFDQSGARLFLSTSKSQRSLRLRVRKGRSLAGEIVFGRRGIDLNGGQLQTRGFVAQDLRKHPIRSSTAHLPGQ